MSLIVSLRVPDGIVVAVDSLSTAQKLITVSVEEAGFECPHCKERVSGREMELPQISVPYSASSYTQKLFPIAENFAIGSIGQGVVNKKSIYYHIKQFERNRPAVAEMGLVDICDGFADYLEEELKSEYPDYEENAPDDWYPIAFHVNGYQDDERGRPTGTTYELFIGKERIVRKRDMIGCTVGGDMKVVRKLWDIGKENPEQQIKYDLLSLQDAVDLATFFINATGTFQKYANEVQTVGGEVDVALLTPFHGFQWIRRKTLMATVEGDPCPS